MNEYLEALKRGAIKGAKSAPSDFFLPITWLFKKLFSGGNRQTSKYPDVSQQPAAEKSEKNQGKAAHS